MAAERKRIGLREVRALGPNEEVWDAAVPGFGARRQRSEAIAYVLLYRTKAGRSRRLTIGRHGAPWTPDTARDEARRLLGDVSRGGDPAAEKRAAREAVTVAELCDTYIGDAEVGRLLTRRGEAKRASTLLSDRGRIAGHIKPLLGSMPVATVTRQDVTRFMHAVAEGQTAARTKTGKARGLSNLRGGRGVASRSVGLLGAIFSYAVEHGMRTDNPVRGVTRFADQTRERRLSEDEYALLGAALRNAEAGGVWPPAIAAIRLLLMTGWRSGEAIGLEWSNVDLARRTARLPATKTGLSVRPLSQIACEILAAQPRSKGFVFPPTRGTGRMSGFPKIWARIAELGKLPNDITPHVLRHSFASLAADLGYSEATIGGLIGHKASTVTSRYMHTADAVLLAGADSVAERTQILLTASLSDARQSLSPSEETGALS